MARVFGSPVPGIESVAVDDPALAALLADADGRLGANPGAALLPGQVLRVSCRPGTSVDPVVLDDVQHLPEAVALAADVAIQPGTVALVLDVDLDGPAPAGLAPIGARAPERAGSLPLDATGRVIVLAGPGVVRSGTAGALRAFAERAGIGVANTWGAKGLFDWRSPHHMGTVGLQERDFELCGFEEAALLIASGLDFDESPRDRWALAPVADVPAHALGELASAWAGEPGTVEPNELFTGLAAVVQPLYRSDAFPLSPARAVIDLAAAMGPGGLVTADPGPAGFWVARAFPTSEPGTVAVPATVADGFAAAAALVGRLRDPSRRVVAVTTAPRDPTTDAVLVLARSLGLPLLLETWGDAGDVGSAGDHAATLERADGVVDVAVDLEQTQLLVDVAGELVAWR